jgi:putative Mg2+ transporter-C (MgtC) family protein
MMSMPLSLQWSDVALRLLVTTVAGLLLGYNRSEHGKSAGMRTTLLVCMAASVAMIQVNMLLPTAGRASDSFVMNDLMRLPLGILTGVGFIGGGAILRRDTLVIGLTTAATLWLATIIGLCIGGGQILLGVISTVLGLFALWILKWVEGELQGEVRARLEIKYASDGPDETQLIHELQQAGLRILRTKMCVDRENDNRIFEFEVSEMRRLRDVGTPAVIHQMTKAGALRLTWTPQI